MRAWAALLAPAVVVLAAGAAAAPVETLAGAGTGDARVHFQSANPRSAAALLDGLGNDPAVVVFADLAFPRNPSGKVPAMVLVHGSAGPSESRDGRYAAELRALGIATFRLNSFAPRGVERTVGAQGLVSGWSMAADAFQALGLLATHPAIDAGRIGVMGWSKGGGVAYATAFLPLARAVLGEHGPRFAVHLPFYRACLWEIRMAMTGAPVREIIGALDDYTGVAACVENARARRARGDDVETLVLEGAHHGFDGGWPVRTCHRCRSAVECHLIVKPDGRTVNALGIPFEQCLVQGATIGANPAASAEAMAFVKRFLTEVLEP